MTSFKQYFNEYRTSTDKWTKLHQFAGRVAVESSHFKVRRIERGELTEQDIKIIIERTVKKLIKTKMGKEKLGEYLTFSKEFNQGFVFEWRRDDLGGFENNKNGMALITYLPRGKSTPKPYTKLMIVEYINEHDIPSDIQIIEID